MLNKPYRLNDEERRMWIENDESLYRWWKSSRIGLYRFVRENRQEIDSFILPILNKEPVS